MIRQCRTLSKLTHHNIDTDDVDYDDSSDSDIDHDDVDDMDDKKILSHRANVESMIYKLDFLYLKRKITCTCS